MSRRETAIPLGKPKSGESGAAVRVSRAPATGVPVRASLPCLTQLASHTLTIHCPGKVEEICGLMSGLSSGGAGTASHAIHELSLSRVEHGVGKS